MAVNALSVAAECVKQGPEAEVSALPAMHCGMIRLPTYIKSLSETRSRHGHKKASGTIQLHECCGQALQRLGGTEIHQA